MNSISVLYNLILCSL